MNELRASFEIELEPADAIVDGTDRQDFSKTWTGDIKGTSRGALLSAGDPRTGTAGYVAIEVFWGTIDGKDGTVAFQQSGTMVEGEVDLRYEIVPGSGTGDLDGLLGTLEMVDGTHEVVLKLKE